MIKLQVFGLTDNVRGTIISAIRLRALLIFGNSIDPSWDYVLVTIWTAAELGVAMIAASLPALRSLFIKICPVSLKSFNFSKLSKFSILPSFSFGSRETSGGSGRGWKRGSRKFEQLEDIDFDMTKVTVNGEEWSYPRKQPAVPAKIIRRDSDGRFRPDDATF